MLLMLGVVLRLLPGVDGKVGIRVGEGSSKSSSGEISSGSGSNEEKGDRNAPMFGVVGDGVAVVVDDSGASLK